MKFVGFFFTSLLYHIRKILYNSHFDIGFRLSLKYILHNSNMTNEA